MTVLLEKYFSNCIELPRKNLQFFRLCSIITYIYELFILKNKISVTTADVNELSSEIHGNTMPPSEQKL